MLPSHERVVALFWYDPASGLFVRRTTGRVSNTNYGDGYDGVNVDGRCIRAARLAWFYVHGNWPKGQIDHIDRNRKNNAISNLRDVSPQENSKNRVYTRANKTGYAGVSIDRHGQLVRYRASIAVNGKNLTLGRFFTPEAAHQCYLIHRDFFV